MKTKNDSDKSGNIYGLNLVVECDHKAKEERVKYENDQKMKTFILEEIFV